MTLLPGLTTRLIDYDPSESVTKLAMLVWDTNTLSWIKYTGSSGTSGGATETTLASVLTQVTTSATNSGTIATNTGTTATNTALTNAQKVMNANDRTKTFNYDGSYKLTSIVYASSSVGKTVTDTFTWADFGTANQRVTEIDRVVS